MVTGPTFNPKFRRYPYVKPLIRPNSSFAISKEHSHCFSPPLTKKVDALLAKDFNFTDKQLIKRLYGNRVYGYIIEGFDGHLKAELIDKLNSSFRKNGIGANAVDSAIDIDIILKGINKSSAIVHFSKLAGIAESDIVRIGDQPFGNDREMLSKGRAYNVGQKANLAGLKNSHSRGPDGVLEIFSMIEKEGFNAVVLDIDGTVDDDIRVIQKIKEYLVSGKKVAVVTGRGKSIKEKFIDRLEGLRIPSRAKQNLFIYLFNGALFLQG